MTTRDARALKVGDEVRYLADGERGVVEHVRPVYIRIRWASGEESHIHPNDCGVIERVPAIEGTHAR